MGLGAPALQTSQKREQAAGPPFAVAAAYNGLSVDPVTGQIVLGQDLLQVGNPAALVSNREIPMMDKAIDMLQNNGLLTQAVLRYRDDLNQLTGEWIWPLGQMIFRFTDNNSGAILDITFNGPNAGQVQYRSATGATISGHILTGGGTSLFRTVLPKVANYVIPANSEQFNIYTNENAAGAVRFSLPGAGLFNIGDTYTFYVITAQNLIVDPAAGTTARVANLVTTAAGTVTSNVIGSTIEFVALTATEWHAMTIVGAWIVT